MLGNKIVYCRASWNDDLYEWKEFMYGKDCTL